MKKRMLSTILAIMILTGLLQGVSIPVAADDLPSPVSAEENISVFRGTRTDLRDESVYTLIISRFYDGDSGNNVHCWDDGMAGNPDSDPAWRGDFKGLIEKLDYIKALGFTAVRLNPVVQNASGYDYHGFHAINLKDVDFRLESDGYTYEDLIDACHARGLKVIQGVVLNHTSNFGEEYLRKLFELDEEAAWSVTESLIPMETLLEHYPNYADMPAAEQYQARLDMLRANITETLNADEHYHRERSMEYDSYLKQQGQIAGDCIDINTENPEVALYLAESCLWYAQMGVDAICIDAAESINRWTYNEGILPLLNDLLEEAGLELDIYAEVVSRDLNTWFNNTPSLSVPFYSWAETEDEWKGNWDDTDPTANIQTSIDHYHAHDTTEKFEIPTSTNALLDGIEYHTPDYSESSGMYTFDFTMMWNFANAQQAFNAAKNADPYMNDATWNMLSVDNWDYGPGGMEKIRYSEGIQAWKSNLNLMFTFRGIPSIYYGSEIEFQKGMVHDVGPGQPLSTTGRAYYGDHLEGTVTATEFGEYEAAGKVADTLNSPLSQHIRTLNEMRRKIPALRKGQYTTDSNYVNGNIAFIRRYTNKSEGIDSLALVAITTGATFKNIPNGKYVDAVSGNEITVTNSTLAIPTLGSTGLAVYVCCADGFTGLDAELPVAESVLRFNVNGDTVAVEAITTKNGEAELPAAPELPDGYTFLGWIVNGEEYQPGDTVEISVDSMARAIYICNTVSFVPNIEGGRVTVSHDSPAAGDQVIITVIPDEGKEVDKIIVKKENEEIPVTDIGGGRYSYVQPAGNVTIEVIFEDAETDSGSDSGSDLLQQSLMMLFSQQFRITASATEGGTITSEGVTKVKYDKTITYTITPDEGYEIKDVLVNGKSVGAVSEYTIKRVKDHHTIEAVFEKIKWQNPFTDVTEADWFYEDIAFVSETGLMNGTAETKFSPDAALTRAMLVTVLWRLEGEPVVNYVMPFTDAADGEWYTEAVRWAAAEGIVNGYEDSTFRHGNEITREQTMAILHRYAAYKGLDSGMIFPMIPQYDYSLWAENDIIWADMVGLTSGLGVDIYDMTAAADRAEIAAYLRQFCANAAE